MAIKLRNENYPCIVNVYNNYYCYQNTYLLTQDDLHVDGFVELGRVAFSRIPVG